MEKTNFRFRRGALVATLLISGFVAPGSAPAEAQLFSSEPKFVVTCRLTIDDGTSDPKVRTLVISTVRTPEESRMLVQVTSPAALKNLKFLRIETKSGTGTWLKTSRGTQRLPSDSDPEPLFGSDFTTADFLPGSDNWTTLAPSGDVLVRQRPAEPRLGWSKQVLSLRRTDELMLQSDFFDGADSLVRSYRVLEFSADAMPRVAVLEDKRAKRSSRLEVLSFDPKAAISPTLFVPGNL